MFVRSELEIIRIWSEKGEGSPFLQEISLLKKLKLNAAASSLVLSRSEVNIVNHWAEQFTKGGHFLFERELKILQKIEKFLQQTADN